MYQLLFFVPGTMYQAFFIFALMKQLTGFEKFLLLFTFGAGIAYLAKNKSNGKHVLTNGGARFIQQFEGLKLKAYQDSAGVWTIGYGHTGNVQPGDEITLPEAISYFKADAGKFVSFLDKWLQEQEIVLNSRQFDALISFIYNVGSNAFKNSTLAKRLKEKNFPAAADEFLKWVNAGGSVLPGLVTRRKAERELFIS